MEIPREKPLPPEVPTLVLSNTEDVLKLGARLDGIRLIILDFPKFTDGRAYTQARLLRERLGYTGFDSFASAQKGFGEALAKARTLFSVVYQPTGDGRTTANELRLKRGNAVAA
jgi:uncharacterized protein (DUF934 family)